MIQDTIKKVADLNPTAEIIIKDFASRQRFRRATNLNKHQNDLLAKGEKIVEKEYFETFKMLQDLGVGSLIIGRGNKPTRFKWHFNLKDSAKAAMGQLPASQIRKLDDGKKSVAKRGRGRPPGSKNKKSFLTQPQETTGPISVTIHIDAAQLKALLKSA